MNLCRSRRKFLFALVFFASARVTAGEPRVIELAIAERKPAGGVRTVRVQEADQVELRVRSDEPLTVHVHAYRAEARVAAGSVATLAFAATMVGRFPVTAHLPGAQEGRHEAALLYLEVRPR